MQEIEVCEPIKDIYRIFDIEEKQSVIKINGGSNHCHHAKRRWVVKRTNSWHNRFRKLLVRHEKKLESYFAVVVCLGLYYYLEEDNFRIGSVYSHTD